MIGNRIIRIGKELPNVLTAFEIQPSQIEGRTEILKQRNGKKTNFCSLNMTKTN